MKTILVVFLCLIAPYASAKEFVFRGDFIETHSVKSDDFMKTAPSNVELECPNVCSKRYVRIYVFKNSQGSKSFWSADSRKIEYDDTKWITRMQGKSGHIVFYDENYQMIYRSNESVEADMKRSKEIENAPTYTNEDFQKIMNESEAARTKELKAQEGSNSDATHGKSSTDNPSSSKSKKHKNKSISDVIDSL